MAFLMHIGFDSATRFRRSVYYFQYNGVKFKYIENDPRKWTHVLLSIAPSFRYKDEQTVLAAAGEFVSALSWATRMPMTVRPIGGNGVPKSFTLRQATCRTFSWPEMPFMGLHVGADFYELAHIQNEEQRVALALFREASSGNKSILSFLLYWQIVEIGNGDARKWVNKMQVQRPPTLRLSATDLQSLGLGGRHLGDVLEDDCRHAIAHIRRWPGRVALKFDDIAEIGRLRAATSLVHDLAEYYICVVLGVREWRYLVRPASGGFPRYLDRAAIEKGNYRAVAAPRRPFGA